ncbi:MAG: sialate O-acetylesterase [Rikenellaceae bacterium]
MKKFTLLLLAMIAMSSLQAEVRLPAILGDGMVLQRNSEVNIWGWAEAGAKIKVTTSWNSEKFTTTASEDGEWLVKVPTREVMWEQSITISDGDKTTLNNVMIGEVWVCSGQSNMEMPLTGYNCQPSENPTQALIEAKRYPNIRLFTVEKCSKGEPLEDCEEYKAWSDASADNIATFSATAYYFGRTLASFLDDVPIGLVHSSWGGTRIEVWLSEKSYDNLHEDVDRDAITKKGNQEKSASRLYNGMIHPIKNFTARGFIWYQGEANRFHYKYYHHMMDAMVSGWREDWGDDTMPFYFVQIAPYHYNGDDKSILPLLIESQSKAAEMIPHSAMAATTDIGHKVTIHPTKKREVGERLAYLALRNDYGVKYVPMPALTLKQMEIKGDTVTISLNNVTRDFEGGNNSLVPYNDEGNLKIKGFEVAGEDQVYHTAKAWINRATNTISMKCGDVPEPVAVRYAFYNLHEGNVVTCLGQPLVPFRTDDWDIIEVKK